MAMNKQRKTSNILNIFSYDAAGNIVIKDYSQVIRYSWNGTLHGFIGQLSVSSITSATTDTDKFLVSDGGVLKFRTGAEILSDIGGQSTLTLTTTGTSGAATLIGSTLNIPQYSGTNIYNSDGTLTGDRTITSNGNGLTILGGKQVISTEQIGLTLKNSGTSDAVAISLDNIKNWKLRSMNTGSFDIRNITDTTSVLTLGATGGATFVGSVRSSTNVYTIGNFSLVSGIWFDKATPTSSNYTIASDNTDTYINNQSGGGIYFRINNANKALLTQNGRLLLGTTTESTYLLDVNGTARVSEDVLIQKTAASGATQLTINNPSNTNNAYSTLRLQGNAVSTYLYQCSSSQSSYGISANAFVMEMPNSQTSYFQMVFGSPFFTFGQSGMIYNSGGTAGTPVASSALTLNSTTKGFLPPRMTTAQRDLIGTPATGLQVYNTTTNANNYYDGSAWVAGGTAITLSAIGSTPNANAATITGSVLNLEPASASFGGVVTTGTQTFAGAKTFNSTVSVTSNLSTTGILAADLTSTGLTGSANLYGASVITRPTVNAGIAWGSLNIFINQQGILQPTFSGSATFQNSNYVSQELKINRITFAAAASTITMTQATGIRAYSNAITHNYIDGTNDGTISHFANIAMYGDYAASTARFTFTNRYGLLINDFQEYGQGHTYTNRWAIYQDGASDNNYFKGKVIIGSTNTVGASPLNVKNLPTSASGLATGDVWNNLGILNIV